MYSEHSPVPRILYSHNGTPQRQTAAMIPESMTAFNFAVFFSAAAVKFREQVVIVSSFGLDFRKLENSRLLNMEAYSIIWNSSIINEQTLVPQFEVFVVCILLCRKMFVLKISIKGYKTNFHHRIVSKTLRAECRQECWSLQHVIWSWFRRLLRFGSFKSCRTVHFI